MKDKLRFKFKIGEFWGFINMNRRDAILYSTREMKSWKVCSSEVNYEISGDVGTSSFYDLNLKTLVRVSPTPFIIFFFLHFPLLLIFSPPDRFQQEKIKINHVPIVFVRRKNIKTEDPFLLLLKSCFVIRFRFLVKEGRFFVRIKFVFNFTTP